MSISPKGYIVKEWAGYFLNNGGDEVRLFHGDDLVDAFSYENCATGFTWARKGESWLQTSHSTKGQENIVMFESLPSPSAFQSTNLQEQVPLTSTTNGASVSAEAALPLKSKLFDPALIPQLKSTTPSQQSNLISEQLALPSHYRSTNPDPPSTFAWFISAGFWFIAAACAFVSNATMNHVLTIT